MGYRSKDNVYASAYSKKGKKSKIQIKKIAIIAATTIVAFTGGYTVYNHLPFVKVNKAIAAGNRYTENEEYEAAINSYTEAIEIDSSAVTAYSNMAGAYLSIDDSESAKKVLYDGWQNTENKNLLNNYFTVIMNDAVNTMNKGEGNLDTVSSIVSVLEQDNTNKDAMEILLAAYDRCFNCYAEDVNSLFYTGDTDGDNYSKYKEILERLLTVYEKNSCVELKTVILRYAVPSSKSFTISFDNAKDYDSVLEKVITTVGSSDEISSFKACLSNAQEVQGIFADIFDQLDVGNVDELRNFVVSDSYLALRDKFLNNEETPEENTTYVAISREAMILNKNEDKWSYRFLNFEENPDTKGVITLWANFFEDDGVQRNSISFEPGAVDGNRYPHTKYTVTYLRSYTNSGSNTKVAKMNYRLSTAITDENGKITETVIGDWGGTNEYVMDIETIESRIRA